LQQKETRDEIKSLKSSGIDVESDEYDKKINEIHYYSKYLYIHTSRVFGLKGIEEKVVLLNSKDIHINYYTIVHIMNRHFSPNQKQYESDKTFFTPDIMFDELIDFLSEIIDSIDKSGFYDTDPPYKISIRYKDKPYQIYFNKVTKQKEGSGNYECYRINTFYQISEPEDLKKLEGQSIERINEDLELYTE